MDDGTMWILMYSELDTNLLFWGGEGSIKIDGNNF